MKLIHIIIFVFSMLRNHVCNEFVDDCTSPGMLMAQAIENSAMAIGCKTQNSFGFCILSHKDSGAKCTIKFTKPNTYNDQGCHKSKVEKHNIYEYILELAKWLELTWLNEKDLR